MSEDSILFQNLGIVFPHVGKSIEIFGISIAYYGIVISCGMVLAGAFVLYDGVRKKQKQDDYLDVLIWGLIVGIIGARAYYVIFSWDMYRDNPISVLYFREGGLAIYGGIIGGIIGAIITCRKKKLPFFDVADSVCMGLLIGQLIGRWGNFFNREAFGGYTDNILAMQIPLEYFRVNGRLHDLQTGGILEHLMEKTVGGQTVHLIQVHPTFLYEGLWNLMVLLLVFAWRKHKKYDGEMFTIYMLGYGIGRFMIESLRTDQLQVGNTGIAATQVVCILLVIGGILWEFLERRPGPKKDQGSGEDHENT